MERQLRLSSVRVEFRYTEAHYFTLVRAATVAVERSAAVEYPIGELSPEARVALCCLRRNYRVFEEAYGSYCLHWPTEVELAPTTSDVSLRLEGLHARQNEEDAKRADWIAAHRAKLTDGRWNGIDYDNYDLADLFNIPEGEVVVKGEHIPREIRNQAETAYRKLAEQKRLDAEERERERVELLFAKFRENPACAIDDDGDWDSDRLPFYEFQLPSHLKPEFAAIKEQALAQARVRNERYRRLLEKWVVEHGTKSMQARMQEGYLGDEELIDMIRAWAFEPFANEPRLERLRDDDANHHAECDEQCDIEFDVSDADALNALQYDRLCEIRELATKSPLACIVKPRKHTVTAACNEDAPTERFSFRVETEFAGRPLSREYAV